ncbi:hypothetical protein GCM10009645_36900 [Mycolicibacterium poriferae]|uniref:DUF3159 domain-containing protein n=1 Tax=Mycolicibacterium poriferae TaxID=39694 RepID=A0A6N4V9D8_9MYCO|nr:DUF3159 domain-containing protein [Mycolicibacterium poriferae]MCV7263528.1 DUF3159 domain-containing protein [Mycolicibacterium poriferae]BBX50337.1 hypothetical protein MPOR_13630 [Mycolicibacterium poriferae]
MARHRLRGGLTRSRETLSALIASPQTPILQLIGGWRAVFDAVAPNLLLLVVYLATVDLVAATMSAMAMAVLMVLARAVAAQPVAPAVGGLLLVAMSALMALAGGDGGDVFLPDLIQTGVFSAIMVVSIAVRRPLIGMVLGPVVSGRRWRTDPVLLRGYDWATALMATAAAIRTVSKLPFYFADDVVGLSIADLVAGVPLAVVTTYLQIRVLRRAYAAAGATAPPLEPVPAR